MPSIGTWWRTIRHLRREQIVGRLAFRLARPLPDRRPAPPRRAPAGAWAKPPARVPSLEGEDRFRFLNEAHDLAAIGWDNPALEKLWRYNLHYFDDLAARDAGARRGAHRRLIGRWIEENPPASGTGWEPYPVSLRIINWIKWCLDGADPDRAMLSSLAIQARWLSRRLEWHLLGNHLFVNAKALALAGLFFEGSEADGWRATALSILERQLPEQILADGGQFERSPMYHALALEDVLDLINAFDAFGACDAGERMFAARLRPLAQRMLAWLRAMTFPNGGITHFNDSADGIAPPLGELERYAAELGVVSERPTGHPTIHLAESGYVRLASERAIAWLDVAPIGPDYLPGHAHADTLSFELALDGRALIVNGGTSCYGTSAQRHRERGTAMHSTVQIGGFDSSEIWSGFRVGRRARLLRVDVGDRAVEAAHDGYRFLPGRPVHTRSWQLSDDGLTVVDRVEPQQADAVARYHLAPGLVPEPLGDAWAICSNGQPVATVEVDGALVEWRPSEHASEFGIRRPSTMLCCQITSGECRTRWLWTA